MHTRAALYMRVITFQDADGYTCYADAAAHLA